MTKSTELNEFISNQVVEILEITKSNIVQAIEFMKNQNTPYLNHSSTQLLNQLSINTVEAFNKVLIDTEIGYIEHNHIVLTKYFIFNSSDCGTKKIPYSLLFVDKFLQTHIICEKNVLHPAQYELGLNVMDIINNMEEIITSIDVNILLYQKI